MLGILLLINPYAFGLADKKSLGLLIISVFSLSTVFPLICILMMKSLGLISSFEMKGDKERVGPLIATIIFYMWLFLNLQKQNFVPPAFTCFVLGTLIALGIGFFLSIFGNISLHTIGMGGLLAGLIMIRLNFAYETFPLDLGNWGQFLIRTDLLIMACILLTGLVGTARLGLRAHRPAEVYGGMLIGGFSQFLAFALYF